MTIFTFYLNKAEEIYALTDTQLTEKRTRLEDDRYLIETEIRQEVQALTTAKIDVHVYSLEPFVCRGILGAFPNNWWEEFI